MKDSGIEWIGKIPEDWETMRIQFCLDEVVAKNNPIQTTQVLSLVKDKGVMLYEEKGDMGNKAKEDCSEYKIAYPNTLVVNSMNILIGSVGISNYFGCVSPVYYVFKEKDISDLRYINYIFNTTAFQKELRRYANGILEIRLRVSADNIFKRKIPLPHKSIQIKIADFLDDKCKKIDDLISYEEVAIDELKAYKKSVITETVIRGLDDYVPIKDSDVEWIGEVPEHWEISRVKHLGWTQNGISKGGDFFGQGYPFVSYGDVYKNIVLPETVDGLIETTAQEQKNYSVEENDIFFTRTSETIEEVGFSCICKKTIPNATFAGFLIRLRLFNNERLYLDYAKYYFRGVHIREYLVKEMNLVTRASLGQDLLKAMSVLLPPIEEQKQIADYLDKKCSAIDNLISIKQQKIEELKEYKKSLIYEYVTGKKEVV